MSNEYISFKASVYLLIILFISNSCNTQKPFLEGVSLKRDSYHQELDAFGEFLWSRNTEGSINIIKKNFKQIHRNCKSSEDAYFDLLYGYSISLTTKKTKIAKELSNSERAYVGAYVVEYLYKCQRKFKEDTQFKDTKFINRFLAPWNANNYNREFKKHNYYGLKLLKKHHLKHYFKYSEEDTIPSKKKVID